MKFPYLAYRGFLRPIIPVTICYNDQKLSTVALVDSGADISLFDVSLAQALEINFSNVAPKMIGGLGGLIEAFPATVQLRLQRHQLELSCLFAANVRLNLLGRQDFFRYFRVCFSEAHQFLELIRRRPKQRRTSLVK